MNFGSLNFDLGFIPNLDFGISDPVFFAALF